MGENILGKVESNGTDKSRKSTSAGNTERGRGRGNGTTTVETSNLPKPVVVEVPGESPGDKKEEPKKKNKPGAGRPPGTTKNKKPAANKPADTTQLKLLVLTISGLIASRPGMEVWNLSADEVDQIIEPLSNIMARHNVGQAAGEYADYISLVVAASVIFIPKYLIWKAQNPKKEKVKSIERKQPEQPKERTPARNDTRNDVQPAADNSYFGGELFNSIPAIAGI